MAQSAIVQALQGRVLVIDVNGQPRLLVVGDRIQVGDTVRPASGASVELLLDNGQIQALTGNEALLMGADAPVPADPAATAAITAVIDALARGEDLDDLDAAAAGAAGGGGGDGSSFVRLLRISEGVSPLAYEYGRQSLPPVDTFEGSAAAATQDTVSPPPPPGQVPNAGDDLAQAAIVITRNATSEFNGNLQVMGAGEGAHSFETRLALPRHAGSWLMSDASFRDGVEGRLQGAFAITDKGAGSDPAFVVTPNFLAQAGERFTFTANTDLQTSTQPLGQDLFTAEVYRWTDGAWVLLGAIDGAGGSYTHTFAQDGEYRIKFTVDDETPGGQHASAEITVTSDDYFYTITPLPDIIDYEPATGNIFDNDVLGDGDWESHSWSFEGGESDAYGNVTVEGAFGTLVVAPDGQFTYTPSGTTGGTDTFTYTLTDVDGDSDTATLTVQVGLTVHEYDPGTTTFGEADDSGYVLGAANMLVDVPEGEEVDDDASPAGLSLAPYDDGIALGDLLDIEDFSAQALSNYLRFEDNGAGQAVMHVTSGLDANGDGIPDVLQTYTFDQISLLDLQAYAGGDSDVEIIQKLLDEGNLRREA